MAEQSALPAHQHPHRRTAAEVEWWQDPDDAPLPRDHQDPPPEVPRLSLWSVDAILARENPGWLVEGLFAVGALVIVYGKPSSAKTFVVLDMALSIASVRSWLDYAVKSPGRVVYVAGEGGGGLKKRIQAWMLQHPGSSLREAQFILESVQLLKAEDVDLLLTRIGKRRPTLVVLDTLATCMDGGDENSSKDMSLAIAAAKKIIRATGATVILVHHTGKRDGSGERGHSGLRGAADTMLLVETKKGASGDKLVQVSTTKQKDEDACLPITARLTCLRVGTSDDGKPVTSCVLQATAETPSSDAELPVALARALSVLAGQFPNGASSTQWRTALQPTNGPAVPKKTYQNHRAALLARGLVEEVPGRRHRYRVTAAGNAALGCDAPNVPTADNAEVNDCAGAEVCLSSASGTEPQGAPALTGEPDAANAVDRS